MLKYNAIFYRLDDEWGVKFPDIEGIHTGGKDFEEAYDMATDALSGMLVHGRKGIDYSDPTPFNTIDQTTRDDEHTVPVVASEAIMEEYRPKKRVNVMVPVDLLKKIDKHVKDTKGLDRSRFFCEATERVLTV